MASKMNSRRLALATLVSAPLAAHGMGIPPTLCPSLPATLLKARLVNVTAPDGSVSTFDLANAPSHIDILVHSEYTLELTMQVPSQNNGSVWLNSNYFGYSNGMCISTPVESSADVAPCIPDPPEGYVNFVVPLGVQLTNIAPEGGDRTVTVSGGVSVSFNVSYLPAISATTASTMSTTLPTTFTTSSTSSSATTTTTTLTTPASSSATSRTTTTTTAATSSVVASTTAATTTKPSVTTSSSTQQSTTTAKPTTTATPTATVVYHNADAQIAKWWAEAGCDTPFSIVEGPNGWWHVNAPDVVQADMALWYKFAKQGDPKYVAACFTAARHSDKELLLWWKQAGCTTDFPINESPLGWWRNRPEAVVRADMAVWYKNAVGGRADYKKACIGL